MNSSRVLLRLFVSFTVAAIGASVADQTLAQTVPALVNYQGRLANPDGSAIATADYQLTFKVYDAATNGALIWGPQIFDSVAAQGHGARIPVVQGYFNVMLGPVDTNGVSLANAFNGTNRFVEVTVTNRPPISPRQQILTAPFAFQAGNSATLAGSDWSAVFGTNDPVNGRIPGVRLSTGSISLTNMAARQVGTNVGVGGVACSLPIETQKLNSSSFQDITNLSVTIQTTGRPVMAMVVPSLLNNYTNSPNDTLQSGFTFNPNSGNNFGCFRLVRDNGAGAIVTHFGTGAGGASPVGYPSVIGTFIDLPAAGTHSYRLQWGFISGGGSVYADIYNSVLVVFEL